MEDDWAFNSLPHFICKISLAKLLFTCSTETCQEMLCTAGKSVTVQENVEHPTGRRETSCMMIQTNSCRPVTLLQSW